MFHATRRAKRMLLPFVISIGFIGVTCPAQTNAQVVSYLGNYDGGHFTQNNNIVYFCVAVRGPFTPQNAQGAFNTAVGTMARNNETYDGHEVEFITQITPGNEIWVLAGWYNLTLNEGGWIALANGTPTTSTWFTNNGTTGNSGDWVDSPPWFSAGHKIVIRFADDDRNGILVGIAPPQ